MKNRTLLMLLLSLTCLPLTAQIRLEGDRQADIHPELIAGAWTARWISVPGEPLDGFGVYHMRKAFDLETLPERFIVHVSADNRYKLYANGQFVSLGPARGDIYNWNYETVDLAPYLKPGRNVLAAVVWNFARLKPEAQISFGRTGFLLQGNTAAEAAVNTDGSWLCCKNESYAPSRWRPAASTTRPAPANGSTPRNTPGDGNCPTMTTAAGKRPGPTTGPPERTTAEARDAGSCPARYRPWRCVPNGSSASARPRGSRCRRVSRTERLR